MANVTKNRLTALGIVLLLLIVIVGFRSYQQHQAGTVVINYTVSKLETNAITFNGKVYTPQSESSTALTYRLHRGSYKLDVNVPGYKLFSTPFAVQTGSELSINAALKFKIDPTIISLQQVNGLDQPSLTLVNVQYFEGQTWAVLNIQTNGSDPAVVVAEYQPERGTWQPELGPGTYFRPVDERSLPAAIQDYLQTNNYINQGGE